MLFHVHAVLCSLKDCGTFMEGYVRVLLFPIFRRRTEYSACAKFGLNAMHLALSTRSLVRSFIHSFIHSNLYWCLFSWLIVYVLIDWLCVDVGGWFVGWLISVYWLALFSLLVCLCCLNTVVRMMLRRPSFTPSKSFAIEDSDENCTGFC